MRTKRMLFRNALPCAFLFGLMLPLASVTWANEDIDVAVDIDEQNIEVIRVTDTTPPIPKTDASAFSTEIDLERYAGEQKRLEDLLGQAPGVQIRRFGGAGSLAEVSIRGSTSTQVVVLLDGVKMNSGRGGSVDLSSIPLSQLEAVEVSRGGGSWGAGSGAMGGVVELRTRRPDYPSTVLSAQAASFGTAETSIARTQPGEIIDIGFGYHGFITDGDFEFTRVETEFPGGVILRPSTKSATRINNELERHNGHINIGVDLDHAGYVFAQQSIVHSLHGESGLDREVVSPTAGQQRFAEQRVLTSVSQVRWEDIAFLDGEVTATASLSHRLERSKFEDPKPTLGATAIRNKFDDTSTALALRPETIQTMGDTVHRITGEVRLERDRLDPSGASSHDRLGASVSLRDQVLLFGDLLTIAPGVRFNWTDDTGSRLLPSIGLVLEPAFWIAIKGNVDQSFRNPTFYDLFLPDRGFASGNPDLDPERALNYDIGFELKLPSRFAISNAQIGASVFRSDVKNSIIWVLVSPLKIRPINTDDAKIEGVELLASFDVGSFATVIANHTELRAVSEPDSVRLPGRPNRETNVRLEVGPPNLVKGVVEFQRIGSFTVSNGGSYTVPSRTSWNTSVALELCQVAGKLGADLHLRRLWLNVAIDNVSNVAIRDSLSFPQPGRSLRVGLEAQW